MPVGVDHIDTAPEDSVGLRARVECRTWDAFRLLALGLFGAPPPGGSWGFYIAAFTGSYVAGVIAVFAPAGLLVREAALIGLLSPVLGSGDAVILAAASRIWLTALEVLTQQPRDLVRLEFVCLQHEQA